MLGFLLIENLFPGRAENYSIIFFPMKRKYLLLLVCLSLDILYTNVYAR